MCGKQRKTLNIKLYVNDVDSVKSYDVFDSN